LLVARIDSKLIGLPSWLISILYLYAAIQPLFIAFDQPTEVFVIIKTGALIIAFILKLYFFLIILYTLQTGRMLNYFYCVNKLVKLVDDELEKIGGNKGSGKELAEHPNTWLGMWKWTYKKVGLKYPFHMFLLLTLSFILSAFYCVKENTATDNFAWLMSHFEDVLQLIHIPVILVFIYFLYKSINKTETIPKTVKDIHRKIFGEEPTKEDTGKILSQLRDFKIHFLFFWICMLILYVLLPRDLGMPVSSAHANQFIIRVLINSIPDILGSMFIFWCFTIMYRPAIDKKTEKKAKLFRHYSLFAWFAIILLFILGASVIQPMCNSTDFDAHHLQAFAMLLEATGDTLTAVCLALLVARLDSILVDLRSSLISMLYLYAAVQPLFVTMYQFTDTADHITTILFLVVFILKIYLFWLIMYAIQTSRITNYITCFPSLEDDVESVFGNQFVIKLIELIHPEGHHRFSFHINNHNKPVFKSDETMTDREICRGKITDLLNMAKAKQLVYEKKPVEPDNFWVEIKDLKDKLICFSESFKTDKEAEEFMKETKDKLPFCKLELGW
jgi:hypothetical protein